MDSMEQSRVSDPMRASLSALDVRAALSALDVSASLSALDTQARGESSLLHRRIRGAVIQFPPPGARFAASRAELRLRYFAASSTV